MLELITLVFIVITFPIGSASPNCPAPTKISSLYADQSEIALTAFHSPCVNDVTVVNNVGVMKL